MGFLNLPLTSHQVIQHISIRQFHDLDNGAPDGNIEWR
jgi:hypothetical protein